MKGKTPSCSSTECPKSALEWGNTKLRMEIFLLWHPQHKVRISGILFSHMIHIFIINDMKCLMCKI